MKTLTSRLKTLLLLCTVPMLLSACSEVELGSHLYKSWNNTPSPTKSTGSKGSFKVGSPYTVAGKRYYPRETYHYSETGIASWYGPGFHGKKTASGEIYNQNELTAAHRTLQMPSLVRVTNLDNGRSVVVRVNDRGPFAHGRIIDVSSRAASLLGMKGPGVARVKLDLLTNESKALANAAKNGHSTQGVEVAYNQTGRLPSQYYPRPATPPIQQPKYSGPVQSDIPQTEMDLSQTAQIESVPGHVTQGHFYPEPIVQQQHVTATRLYVQAGAFSQEANAQLLATRMASITSAKVTPVTFNGTTLYKVRLGPLPSVREADKVLKKVLAAGQSDAIIVVQQ